MRAIILAAGVGKRLGPRGDERPPKCLLRFGRKSLLERQLASLATCGVSDVVVVTGFGADLVEAELGSLSLDPRPVTIVNPDFRLGSVVSLWWAREHLTRGDDVVLMDADVLFDDRILRCLLESSSRDCFLIDRDLETGDEPVKVCIREGVPVEFRKKVPDGLVFDFMGESVGFFRFSPETSAVLSERTAGYVESGRANEPHEEVIRDLLLDEAASFSFEDVTGLPWIEIDFPGDVQRAETEILPRLSQQTTEGAHPS